MFTSYSNLCGYTGDWAAVLSTSSRLTVNAHNLIYLFSFTICPKVGCDPMVDHGPTLL